VIAAASTIFSAVELLTQTGGFNGVVVISSKTTKSAIEVMWVIPIV
jgi:hypothetical protein